MQGVASLGYEVQELPMVPEGGIQQYSDAADILAEFGRNGDTYIVHAAEGETMVPMEVLENNPRLKSMLWEQFEEMGIEPERYIVGNELNSLNPVTGKPEFFLKKIFKGVKKAVKKVANVVKKVAPIILPIAAPFLLPAMPIAFATGIGSLAGNLIAGNSFKDSLKSAVISGGLAGLGNVAFGGSEGFGSGKFFGSMANPTAGLGEFSLKQAFTPVNPFSGQYSQTLGNIKAQGTTAQSQLAPVQTAPVPPTGAEQYPISPDTGGAGIDLTQTPPTEPKTFFGDVKKAAIPGDNYGPVEFYGDYISPSRPSIQPTPDAIANKAVEIANADIVAATKVNESLVNAGLQAAPIDTAAIQTAAIEKAKVALAPSMTQQYLPLAAAGTAAAVGADYATDGAVLGVFGEQPEDGSIADMPTGEDYYAQDPGKYGFGSDFYGRNPYYQDPTFMPPAVRTSGGGSGQTIAQMVAQNTAPVAANTPTPANTSPFDLALGGYNRAMYPYIRAASGGEIVGPGTPTSDSIPALLSDGEFVMNARAVRGAGGGDRRKGAQRMYSMMRDFEQRAV